MQTENQQPNEGAQQQPAPIAEKVPASPLDQVAALLRGDKPKPDADDAGDDSQGGDDTQQRQRKPEKRTKPKSLAEAAERLGVDVSEMYGLEFGMPNDKEKYTLGQLKDFFGERQTHTLDQMRWAETKAQQEGDLARSRNEFAELIAMLPQDAIKPESLKVIREKHERIATRERERTLHVIPEWHDDVARNKDLDGMREHLERAGFGKGYLDRIADHQTMRYIRENFLREQRIMKALAMVKPKDSASFKPSGKGDNARATRKTTSTPANERQVTGQIAAISQLLQSQKE